MSVQIPLTQGKVAIIDEADYERVSRFKWHAWCTRGKWYARRNIRIEGRSGQHSQTLHTFLMEPPDGLRVDHIDGDGLRCTRDNMRYATQAQNVWNTPVRRDSVSGIKGVGFHPLTGRWRSMIQVDGKCESLGNYATAEEAARAYDARAREVAGEFARLNYPDAEPQPFVKPLAVTNRSGFHGVAWNKSGNKYVAYIQQNGQRVHLGSFANPEHAARVRDAKVKELGLHLRLNFPDLDT